MTAFGVMASSQLASAQAMTLHQSFSIDPIGPADTLRAYSLPPVDPDNGKI
ncbi:hypothetical protein [Mesorhizobium ciceri]|uniref:hypothetical protein n=1 Tax=Mesorhizobium ciceri TaxID=39645 RepID=UPI0002E93D03